eukprot:CAMPEP_0176440002 /NCGR_PEP_ID=MMETSP0127-20121128/20299_1 /TAXON_ID=938130 /ORGANISM="Platyophrya macrostoma, Strain WH" /LENGTH=772 /DNA_ID=CAMNT_0017824419 /DNA_START=130 /DNA_END=2445 /DNA_ORIENTATION=-
MKFGKRMQEEMLEHWTAFYVSYKRLKQLIVRSPLEGEAFNSEVFRVVRQELEKSEAHFRTLLDELTSSHDELLAQQPSMPMGRGLSQRSAKFFPQRRIKQQSGGKGGTPNGPNPKGPTEGTPLVNFSNPEEAGAGTFCSNNSVSMANQSVTSEQSGDNGSFSSGYHHVDEHHTPPDGFFKGFFLRLIGDSRRRKENENSTRVKFVEWYASAHRLEHFAELNLEAIRKSLKKLTKHRSKEGDFTHAIEAEILMSPLTTLMPRLHVMKEHVVNDFQSKFGEPLDQYRDLTIVTKEQWHAKWHFVLLSVLLFAGAMASPLFQDHPAAHKCFALFTLVVAMWITEAIPFFCTAMMIPIVAVPLGILNDPVTGNPAPPVISSRIMLSHVFDHVQILVLGGLTIAKAMGKVHLEVEAAAWLHRYTAHRPSLYLLGVMVLSCLLCCFVSNVAAPLLVLGVIQSTLWEFPSDTNAPKAILLGLAMACNLGGMLSPIASPQNAVAMQVLSFHSVSFSAWVSIALPLVAAALVFTWLMLLWIWKPFEHVAYIPLQVSAHNASSDYRKPRTSSVIFVLVVSLVTVVLWCLPSNLLFGDTGIIALIPIVLFFGVGVLKKEDFNTLSWHLMFLLAGGNMLGVCAKDSKMVDLIAAALKSYLAERTPYVTIVAVIGVVGLVTTFVSHTVAAMILLPIISKIGYMMPHASIDQVGSSGSMWEASPQALVFLSVLMCSGAMAFPISSFPNVNSLLAEDEFGQPYLKARDFLGIGTVVTVALIASLVTW